MTKRLQVLLDDREYKDYLLLAKSEKTKLAEWVRRALRDFATMRPQKAVERKLRAIDRAYAFSHKDTQG